MTLAELAMPKDHKRQKRRADARDDALGAAAKNYQTRGAKGIDKAAQLLGQRGGRARAKALTAERRKEIAEAAAHARWKR